MIEKKRRKGDKTERCDIRMTREEVQKLEEVSKILGVSKTDVLREGIHLMPLKAQFN